MAPRRSHLLNDPTGVPDPRRFSSPPTTVGSAIFRWLFISFDVVHSILDGALLEMGYKRHVQATPLVCLYFFPPRTAFSGLVAGLVGTGGVFGDYRSNAALVFIAFSNTWQGRMSGLFLKSILCGRKPWNWSCMQIHHINADWIISFSDLGQRCGYGQGWRNLR